MPFVRHMRKTPYELPAAQMSNNATDPVELDVFAALNRPLSSSNEPLFQSESTSEVFIMNISSP